MTLPKKLYKTTVIIWSKYDPTDRFELDDLAIEAMSGEFYCSEQHSECVDDAEDFPDTEFFGIDGEDDEPVEDENEGPPSSTRSDMDD